MLTRVTTMRTSRTMIQLLALAAGAAAASNFGGGGGGQKRAEALKAHALTHGAPAHPLHIDRPEVRSGQSGKAAFTVGASSAQPFTHFFETCVGSGHMSLTLREDWRQHIRMAARDLGVKPGSHTFEGSPTAFPQTLARNGTVHTAQTRSFSHHTWRSKNARQSADDEARKDVCKRGGGARLRPRA